MYYACINIDNVLCFDYNWTVLLLELSLLYIELKSKDNILKFNLKRDLALGILAGFTILCKQSSGLIFAIGFIFYKILNVKNKENFKEYLKIVGIRLFGVIIPIIIFLVYLGITGTFKDFVSYGVTGINTFSNKISYMDLFENENVIVKILAYVFPLGIFIMLIIYIASFIKKDLDEKEWFKNMCILIVFSVITTAVIVPISDSTHFIIGSMITIVSIIYLIYVLLKNFVCKKEKLIKFIEIYAGMLSKVLLIAAICNSVYLFTLYIRK